MPSGSNATTRYWLPAACTVDWAMQLTLSFTNPANRERLMFFDERDGLMAIFDGHTTIEEVVRETLFSNN